MMSRSDTLSNKVALITGCSRGIGLACMLKFLQHGAIVYAVCRTPNALDSYLPTYPALHPCYLDITDSNSVKELIQKIKKESSRLDILLNNAAIMQDSLLGMITQQQMEATFQTNVFAPIRLMQYAAKFMQRQKSGSIINMASIMGIRGNSAQIVYSASKGAVIALTKSAARELGPYNIRVNAIAPGVINTELLSETPEEKIAQYESRIALGHMGSPDDVAELARFLASDEARYLTGQVIGIDGMMSH